MLYVVVPRWLRLVETRQTESILEAYDNCTRALFHCDSLRMQWMNFRACRCSTARTAATCHCTHGGGRRLFLGYRLVEPLRDLFRDLTALNTRTNLATRRSAQVAHHPNMGIYCPITRPK